MIWEGDGEGEPTPIKRPNPTVIQQVRKLEQARDEAALLALLDLKFNSIVARRAAAKALAHIARSASVPALTKYLEQEPDRATRLSLINALGKLGDDFALPMLLKSLKDQDAMVRLEAANALSRFNSSTAFEALLAALRQNNEPLDRAIRQFAAEALGQLADRRAGPALVEALKDEDGLVRAASAKALGKLGDRSAISALKRVRHTTPHVRGADCAECKAIDWALTELEK